MFGTTSPAARTRRRRGDGPGRRRPRVVPDGGGEGTASGVGSRRRRARVGWSADTVIVAVGVVVTLLPLGTGLVLLLSQVRRPWYPTGDLAIIELATRSVTEGGVLLGPYSRMGWNHPGPMMFLVLAAPYRLLGGTAAALPVGAAGLNLLASTGILAVAHRKGGAVLLSGTFPLLALLMAAMGAEQLRDPWNPSLAMVPFGLFVLVCWSLSCGSRWALPLVVGLGSFLVQTHVGYVPVVALVAGVAALSRRRDPPAMRRRPWRSGPAWSGAVVGVALWALPAWEQLTHRPGNMTALARYIRTAQPSWSILDGLKVAAIRSGALLAEVTGTNAVPDPRTLGGAPVWCGLVTIAALGAASVLAWRRRAGRLLRLSGLAWAVIVGSWVTATRIEGPAEDWLIGWMAIGSLLAWLVVVWASLALLLDGHRVRRALALSALAVTTAVVAAGNTADAVRAPALASRRSDVVGELHRQLRRALRTTPAVVLTFGSSAGPGPSSVAWGAGLASDLEQDGLRVRVDRRWRYQFGEVMTGGHGEGTALVVTTDSRFRPTGARLVAHASDVRVYSLAQPSSSS